MTAWVGRRRAQAAGAGRDQLPVHVSPKDPRTGWGTALLRDQDILPQPFLRTRLNKLVKCTPLVELCESLHVKQVNTKSDPCVKKNFFIKIYNRDLFFCFKNEAWMLWQIMIKPCKMKAIFQIIMITLNCIPRTFCYSQATGKTY